MISLLAYDVGALPFSTTLLASSREARALLYRSARLCLALLRLVRIGPRRGSEVYGRRQGDPFSVYRFWSSAPARGLARRGAIPYSFRTGGPQAAL